MNRKTFENLRYTHMCILLDTLSTTNISRMPHIRRLFSERGEGFDEIVLFLSRLGIVASDGRSLRLRINWPKTDKILRRSLILKRLFSKRNRYRSEVFRFLIQFKVLEGGLAYLSSPQNRSAESGVRNFLMDVGIVRHVMGTEKYVLLPEYTSIFVSARDSANHIPPALLEASAVKQSEIGNAAEELIVDYEQSRVGPSYSHYVDRVSIRNSAAGYDIRSISLEADGQALPRFIEVKAVSLKSFQFYWSRNEVDVARALAHWYYLYLLPVNRRGQFDIDGLKVIPDPCNIVLPEDSIWVTESDALICYVKADKTR